MPDTASTSGSVPSKIGAYKLVRLLGKGGMGNVYEAVNEQIQRRAAIKVLHPHFAENPQVVQRFLNEARAVNIVKHRCLVDVYEFGQLDDGAAYIVMEYLDGETLHERLWHAGGRLPTELVVRYGRQIALALAAAHTKGIIHRDLKPANIMLVEDPETGAKDWVKVLDFGLARVREPGDGEEGRLTQTGMVMGTPSYMSPEQVRSARSVVDKSDVYALGVMLYEMVSGQKPFNANSDAEVMFMHMSAQPRPLQELMPGLQSGLYDLIGRMLRKKPEERPSAAEVASSLARVSGLQSATNLPVTPKSAGPDRHSFEAADTQEAAALNVGASATVMESREVPTRPGKKGRGSLRVVAIVAAVLIALGGLGLVAVLRVRALHAKVHWSIRSVPAGAEVVTEAGAVLGLTPYSSERSKQTGSQRLTLRLSGYQEVNVQCEGPSDCQHEVSLVATPASADQAKPPTGNKPGEAGSGAPGSDLKDAEKMLDDMSDSDDKSKKKRKKRRKKK
ncbi:MAG: serine/threonine protein kinase [Myxococcales bacterium]|nr:serine/threonine protein kinase [Myxococcales bacterium]